MCMSRPLPRSSYRVFLSVGTTVKWPKHIHLSVVRVFSRSHLIRQRIRFLTRRTSVSIRQFGIEAL